MAVTTNGEVESPQQAISAGLSRLLRRYTGSVPARSHTVIDGNLVACLHERTFSRGELELVARGEDAVVLDIRRRIRQAMEADVRELVESATGRTVVAMMAATNLEPDCAAEIFVLGAAG